MKKNILIYTLNGKNWMGGIYYIKNLLFQLSISLDTKDKYNFYIHISDSIICEFLDLIKIMNIKIIKYNELPEYLLVICSDYKIDVVMPILGGGYTWILKDINLYWIPDFQEAYFPENFSNEELKNRKIIRKYIAEEHKALILSSRSSYNDYKTLYPQNIDNVFVVHFVSCINSTLNQITDSFEKKIMKKYRIHYDYIFVANQFWKHKNHIVVLKAIEKIVNKHHKQIHLICTGFMQSYGEKNDEYVEMLYKYIEEYKLQKYVHFLGLLERKEQLCIMKNSKMVIQPSKFEGWGCSVEDAKVMGKQILLSDIEVHKEQKYTKSILFSPNDSETLVELIIKNLKIYEKYDLEYGNEYMLKKAYQYSKELQIVIDSMKKVKKVNYLMNLENLRNQKVIQLFRDLPSFQICIYGTGKSTESMLKNCRLMLRDTRFVYSDSDEKKWGMEFEGGKIYPPSELLNLGIKRIIISSIKYQENIYKTIKKYEKDIEIVKIYNSYKEKAEPLWL